MNREELRLELLKLAYRHDRDEAQVVARARAFETYVMESAEHHPVIEDAPARKGGRKKVGNSTVEDILG